MKLLLTLILFVISVSSWATDDDNHCDRFLSIENSGVESREFQSIYHADAVQRWMSHYFTQYLKESEFSMTYDVGRVWTTNSAPIAHDVVSFGSGPDIFTPLINFPLARRIHLVDLTTGWGEGSGRVLLEIFKRARAINPTSKIQVKKVGFVNHFPTELQKEFISLLIAINDSNVDTTKISDNFLSFSIFKDDYPMKANLIENLGREPFVIKVSWIQEAYGPLETEIYLHPIDFNKPEHLGYLNSYLGSNPLAGIVVTGIGFPLSLKYYVDKIAPGGHAILETFVHPNDWTSGEEFIRDLEVTSEYKVNLGSLKAYRLSGDEYVTLPPSVQRRYVIEKIKK
jgi:hypothetical protein